MLRKLSQNIKEKSESVRRISRNISKIKIKGKNRFKKVTRIKSQHFQKES